MDGKSDTFNIDKELDLRSQDEQTITERVQKALESVKKGNFMLVYVNRYEDISVVAKAAFAVKATVDNVLKKNENDWVVMVKNEVPVAQAG
ncbi:hypothetical protein [Hippea alviniae]|uniref:hypothetical protein n=1 Tax=Hippea alviniae TaxID=1279027 RepID=UPI000479A1D7|nr:hypothetical protein [Hippea alviniae]